MFHRHDWRVIQSQKMEREVITFKGSYSPVTLNLYECAKCHEHRTQTIDGWWPQGTFTYAR